MSMFTELRKRHILEIALIYLGAGWLCVEIADFIVGNYGFSRKILDTVVLLAILGFPAFVIIGWFHGERGQQRVKRVEVWLLLTLAVLGGIGTYRIATAESPTEMSDSAATPAPADADGVARLASGEPAADLGRGSLAVLPFRNNLADSSLAWLGTGLADLLTTNFAQRRDLEVVGRQRLYDLLTEEGRTEQEAIPEGLATTVARAAGAHTMLWGSVSGSAEDLVIDAQLIDLERGTVRGAERVRGGDVFALVDSLTTRLSAHLGPERGTARPALRVSHLGTKDIGALADFQRGIALEREGKPAEATRWFERAAERDTTFALPLIRLAGRAEWENAEWNRAMAEAETSVGEPEFEAAVREAEAHRRRAVRLLERMGDELNVEVQGMTRLELLAHLDSTLGEALSSTTKYAFEFRTDSTGRLVAPPRPPRARGPDSTDR